jgi:hypothetical protein
MGGEKQVADQFSALSPETIIVSAAARGQVIDPLTAADADNLVSSPYMLRLYPSCKEVSLSPTVLIPKAA